ncbi:methyltransferase GidB [Thermaerobacter marianensis DSM 12885]|uniref:Ribosomal RNA small subunit methyltransferase G n=1 Tax=Thermaerobacter marianensis (strain ATCC 700841 / DSM 12885 / JCM 10246 / 7p75a) TaxID=644966 RepID=E6SLY8_THEM7|nr:16S rRNA (guanine(527)-N(7))-methyltransferase RsmG [Thermaerobacter marianensis]ADU52446.1 methyltransferase GidB [Thermaerobacter marianensis DSM 12885]
MDPQRWKDELARRAAACGVAVDGPAVSAMRVHWEMVREAGARFNLTGIDRDDEALVLHYLDSLLALSVPGGWPAEGLLVDLGSGAGFPGIPLLVALGRGWRGLLLEAQQKKAAFLADAVQRLGLAERVTVAARRAEEVGRDPQWRGQADAVTARALAPLDVVLEYGLPLLRPGGRLWAYKGPRVEEEWAAGRRAAEVLGGRLADRHCFGLPGGAGRRVIVEAVKERPTPERYPRRPGVPARRPLGRKADG